MNLEKAQTLFEEIVELCYQSGNPRIIEVLEDIYPEVTQATDVSRVIHNLDELQLAIMESDLLPEEQDAIQDVQEKIEMMSE